MDMNALSRVEFLRKENKILRKNLQDLNEKYKHIDSLSKLAEEKAKQYVKVLYYLDVRLKDIF